MENITLIIQISLEQELDDVEASDFVNNLVIILERECTEGELAVGVLDFSVDLVEHEL